MERFGDFLKRLGIFWAFGSFGDVLERAGEFRSVRENFVAFGKVLEHTGEF